MSFNISQQRRNSRFQRHERVRRKISGTPARPRLSVFRSARHIYAQVIDDSKGCTLVSASTVDKEVTAQLQGSHTGNLKAAQVVGKVIAERLLKQSIENVVFDRGGFLYHGRIKAVADAAREAGLKF